MNPVYLSAPYRRAWINHVTGNTSKSAPALGGIMIPLQNAAQQIAAEMIRITASNTEQRIKAEQQRDAALNRAQIADNAMNNAIEQLRAAGFDGPLNTMISDVIQCEKDAAVILARKDVQLSSAFANARRQAERIELLQGIKPRDSEFSTMRDDLDRDGYGNYTIPEAVRELLRISREHFSAAGRHKAAQDDQHAPIPAQDGEQPSQDREHAQQPGQGTNAA